MLTLEFPTRYKVAVAVPVGLTHVGPDIHRRPALGLHSRLAITLHSCWDSLHLTSRKDPALSSGTITQQPELLALRLVHVALLLAAKRMR